MRNRCKTVFKLFYKSIRKNSKELIQFFIIAVICNLLVIIALNIPGLLARYQEQKSIDDYGYSDIQLTLASELDYETLKSEYVNDSIIYEYRTSAYANNTFLSVVLSDENNIFENYSVNLQNEMLNSPPPNYIILSNKYIEKNNLKIGDTIELYILDRYMILKFLL